MLHFMLSQMAETTELDTRLCDLRRRAIQAALDGNGTGMNTAELESEAEEIFQEIHAKYRSDPWKKRFPPPDEEEPNPEVHRLLESNRENAMRTVMMLHQLIMETPVLGCEPASDEG